MYKQINLKSLTCLLLIFSIATTSCNQIESFTYKIFSSSILKEFHEIDKTLTNTKLLLEKSNEKLMTDVLSHYKYKESLDMNGKVAFADILKLQKVIDEGIYYFDGLKEQLITTAGGRKGGNPENEIAQASNISLHVNLFKNGALLETKNVITQIRNELFSLNFHVLNNSNSFRQIENYANLSWSPKIFDDKPLAAVIAEFSIIQIELLNCQSIILNEIKESIPVNINQ
jgi:hypothetical protein